MLRAIVALPLLFASVPVLAQQGAPALDPKTAAAEHKQRAMQEFSAKQYQRAAAEFRAAYAIDPQPEFLFGSAQAERLRGNCAGAAPDYRAFLETHPPSHHEIIARHHLDQCEQILSAKPSETAAQPTPAPAPATAPREHSPWYKDPLGGILVGAGVAAIGIGVGFFIASSNEADAASRAMGRDEFVRRFDDAEGKRTISIVSFVGGAALVSAGVLRYVLRRPASDPQVSLVPTRQGAGVVLFHRF